MSQWMMVEEAQRRTGVDLAALGDELRQAGIVAIVGGRAMVDLGELREWLRMRTAFARMPVGRPRSPAEISAAELGAAPAVPAGPGLGFTETC